MKTCSRCKESKAEAEFSKNRSAKDGLYSRCKACWRDYQQTDACKEYQREYQKAYYLRKKAAASAGN